MPSLIEAAVGKADGIPYIGYFAILVLLAFLADPLSFFRSWNLGRSAMLAIVPLVFLEAGRSSLRPVLGKRKAFIGWLTLGISAVYYFGVAQPAVKAWIISLGKGIGVNPGVVQYSWVWGTDYLATSVFLAVLLFLDRRSRTVTPLIYTVGMASFLFIDSVLPENTLGPFGYVVPPVLQVVASALNLLNPGAASSQGNILMLQNALGRMNLQVFWPSAGLHGIVIGLLVVFAICAKTGTGWRRGALYMSVAVGGSFLVNVLRLVLLASYALANITDPKSFEVFHSVVGELVFIPWIIVFVIVILRRENRISSQARLLATRTTPGKERP